MKMNHYKYILTVLFFSVLTTFSYYATSTFFLNLNDKEIADKNVLSPQTVTYVDEIETQRQKEETLSQIQDIYEKDTVIGDKQIQELKGFFTSVIQQKEAMDKATKESNMKSEKVVVPETYYSAVTNPYKYSNDELASFFELSTSDLYRMKEVYAKELENFYSAGITTDKLDEQKNQFINSSIFYNYDGTTRILLLEKIVPLLEANFKLDSKATELKKDEALKAIKPVTKTIQRGERIVGEGERITEAHTETLKAVGLIQEEFDIKQVLVRFPFVFMLFYLLHIFVHKLSNKEIQNKRLYIFIFTMALISTFLVNLLQWEYFTYGMLVLSLIAIATFLSPSVSIVYAIVLGMLYFPGDYSFLVMAIILGIVQSIVHNPKGDRNAVLNMGLIMAASLVLTQTILQLILGLPIVIQDFLPMIASPIFASILVLGLFGYLERALGVVTSLKLHELTSPHNELYQRLNNEAPGTLQHSLRVGNLAEAAADSIGANGLLLKAGAIYHDVGKLVNPTYFIENLLDSNAPNPHDALTPIESAAIIRQHPLDSVKICKKYKIPDEIIELIEKHHGDDLVKYFYHQALAQDGETIDIQDFIYQTPLPVTKEEGILMLADITEASSRSIMYEEPKVFKEKLTDIIYQKLEDGQMRKCELTVREINIIIDTFIKQLIPANHKRPKYPNQK